MVKRLIRFAFVFVLLTVLDGCATTQTAQQSDEHLQQMPEPRGMFKHELQYFPYGDSSGMLVKTTTQVNAKGVHICDHSIEQKDVRVIDGCEVIINDEVQEQCLLTQKEHPLEKGDCFEEKVRRDLFDDYLDHSRRDEHLKRNQQEKHQSRRADGIIDSPQEYEELRLLFN